MQRIGIVGAGAWGTAFSAHGARRAGRDVVLWARDPANGRGDRRAQRENRPYLPDVALDAAIIG